MFQGGRGVEILACARVRLWDPSASLSHEGETDGCGQGGAANYKIKRKKKKKNHNYEPSVRARLMAHVRSRELKKHERVWFKVFSIVEKEKLRVVQILKQHARLCEAL